VDEYEAVIVIENPPLTPDILQQIEHDFPPNEVGEVAALLTETLGYLSRRQGVNDPRIPKYLLKLAGGLKEAMIFYAAEVKVDYRDIISSVERRSRTVSKADKVAATIERFRKEGLEVPNWVRDWAAGKPDIAPRAGDET